MFIDLAFDLARFSSLLTVVYEHMSICTYTHTHIDKMGLCVKILVAALCVLKTFGNNLDVL